MISSRKYGDQELQDLITGRNIRQYTIAINPEEEDFTYEDTAMVQISMPRGMWKVVYGASQASGCKVGEMISDLACDSVWRLIQPLLEQMLRDIHRRG